MVDLIWEDDGSCLRGLFTRQLYTMFVQQCHMLAVQMLPQQQELYSYPPYLRFYFAAWDHGFLHHAGSGD